MEFLTLGLVQLISGLLEKLGLKKESSSLSSKAKDLILPLNETT